MRHVPSAYCMKGLISRTEHVWLNTAEGIVELGLGETPTGFCVDDRDCVLGCEAYLVGTISYNRSMALVEFSQVVGLLKAEVLVDLPEVGQGREEWPWVFRKWVKVSLINHISDDQEE